MWAPGMCAQTMLGKVQVVLHERADTTGIAVRTWLANYLVELVRRGDDLISGFVENAASMRCCQSTVACT